MWAFAIYNVEQRTLFASRDRFGVKPFYYYFSPTHFIFSSEQKALVMSGLIPRKINKAAAFDYLAFAQLEREPQGLFEGVLELEPGKVLRLDFPVGHWMWSSIMS